MRNDMITFLLSISIISLISICTIGWDRYNTDIASLKKKLWKRDILLHFGEVPKAVWHNEQRLHFIQHGVRRVKEVILFCDAGQTENLLDKLRVTHPDLDKVTADICTNIFHFWKPNEFYPTIESFMESLRMFIPHKKMEIVNGFLNITFSEQLHGYNIHRMICNESIL